jgi:hypothetical protein
MVTDHVADRFFPLGLDERGIAPHYLAERKHNPNLPSNQAALAGVFLYAG